MKTITIKQIINDEDELQALAESQGLNCIVCVSYINNETIIKGM